MKRLDGLAPSLGLLHILEDTVALLEGKTLPADRKDYVLDRSRNLFSDAAKGSIPRAAGGSVVGTHRRRALESFMLLSTYLNAGQIDPDDSSLREVAAVLEKVTANQQVTAEELEGPVSTLRTLCQQMSRDLSSRRTPSQENARMYG